MIWKAFFCRMGKVYLKLVVKVYKMLGGLENLGNIESGNAWMEFIDEVVV